MRMVVTVEQPTDPVVVVLAVAVMLDKKLILEMMAVLVLELQNMDPVVVEVPVVPVLMDPPAHKQQLLEVPEHPIVF